MTVEVAVAKVVMTGKLKEVHGAYQWAGREKMENDNGGRWVKLLELAEPYLAFK